MSPEVYYECDNYHSCTKCDEYLVSPRSLCELHSMAILGSDTILLLEVSWHDPGFWHDPVTYVARKLDVSSRHGLFSGFWVDSD